MRLAKELAATVGIGLIVGLYLGTCLIVGLS